jgi:ribonuclease HII
MIHVCESGEILIAGLDEAGRGPVLGKMVLCGVLFDEGAAERLKAAGVRDSKLLSPKRRAALAELILRQAIKCEVIELSPEEIDTLREKINLNELEAMKFAQILERLKPNVAYVDSTDPNPSRFRKRIIRYLQSKPQLIVENFADRRYEIVAAAAVVAKVRRDQQINELRLKYGDLGSGYSSDPRTIEFLRQWVRKEGKLPPFARKSWETSKRILKEESQREK